MGEAEAAAAAGKQLLRKWRVRAYHTGLNTQEGWCACGRAATRRCGSAYLGGYGSERRAARGAALELPSLRVLRGRAALRRGLRVACGRRRGFESPAGGSGSDMLLYKIMSHCGCC
ncbi:hypothetical protein PLESTB_000456000 [Pleodorina starrii]|uniref:Uncharacterized protein n=1 Tax=Pleodorina starrii TaxID=330485 RepID=A0A9W6BG56_9CHLO|nr:hypothetical protein PLESTM_000757500 [Pleodorina starrii]GLC51007.1 hypothetical protein PLESTB_000456000 [Pleodorina starrii]